MTRSTVSMVTVDTLPEHPRQALVLVDGEVWAVVTGATPDGVPAPSEAHFMWVSRRDGSGWTFDSDLIHETRMALDTAHAFVRWGPQGPPMAPDQWPLPERSLWRSLPHLSVRVLWVREDAHPFMFAVETADGTTRMLHHGHLVVAGDDGQVVEWLPERPPGSLRQHGVKKGAHLQLLDGRAMQRRDIVVVRPTMAWWQRPVFPLKRADTSN